MEGMNTRHLGIRFKSGPDRKRGLRDGVEQIAACTASGSQRISAPDGAKKFSVRPNMSGESPSHLLVFRPNHLCPSARLSSAFRARRYLAMIGLAFAVQTKGLG